MEPGPPPAAALGFARTLAGQLVAASGGLLRAAYLSGSAVLGGWVPGRSDIDMLLVAADDISRGDALRMARALREAVAYCPGRGLECSVVTLAQAAQPASPWPFVVHVAADRGAPARTVYPGSESSGDPDLLMHYAVTRLGGWPACGPPATALIGAVARPVILGYLAAELGWGAEHGSEAYAVLNACRSQIYLTDGQIVSKIAGGETVLQRGTGPAPVIRRALAQQRGTGPDQPPAPDAITFVLATAAALRSACPPRGRLPDRARAREPADRVILGDAATLGNAGLAPNPRLAPNPHCGTPPRGRRVVPGRGG